jgi:steroid 5-alpha reductase family enzyme
VSDFAIGLGVALGGELLVWLASLARRDASLADIAWGPIFVIIAAAVHADAFVFVLVDLWAARLAIHLAWRARGKGEDRRYAAMRARHGARFPWISLGTVFALQGALAAIVALPLEVHHATISAVEVLGAVLVIGGLAIETIADVQLARFRSPDGVLDRGLWAWSRHPNYFGECVVWWGFGVIALGAGAWWALVAPVLMTVLLLRVSGVALLERTIGERRPGYADYARRTSAFVPRPPSAARTG